jgi:hypothetical protein
MTRADFRRRSQGDVSLTASMGHCEFVVSQRHTPIERCKSVNMTRRDQWRRVLAIEVQRWSAMTPEQLASTLDKEQVYEVELDSKTYQVEVEILESTEEYFHVMVAVDDGSLPASIVPETQTLICNKKFRNL